MTRSSGIDRPKQVYRFLLLVTVWWIVALLAWNPISPWYGRLLVSVTNVVLHKNPLVDCEVSYRFEKISIIAHTYFSVPLVPDGRKEYFEGDPSWDGRRFHFSFTVWVALLLATPFGGNWRKKIIWFLAGWGIIFVTQVVGLFLQTIHQNMMFVRGLMPTGRYFSPPAMNLVLAFAGRYFLLIGNFLFPLLVWLPIGVSRLRMGSVADRESGALPLGERMTA